MLLDDIKISDLAVFADGDEAFIEHIVRRELDVTLIFNKKVLGCTRVSSSWTYGYDGKWLRNGNNIVKIVHMNGE